MTFAMLSPFLKHIKKYCPCDDFWLSHKLLRLLRNAKCMNRKCCATTRKLHADIDTPLNYCACHAKRENDLLLWEFEAPKGAFRARLPRVFTRLKLRIDDFMRVFFIKLFSKSSTSIKNIIFCEASATFQGSQKMLRVPRLLTLCHVCAALTLRFMAKTLWPRHKMLRLPRKCQTPHCKVLRLPRENDALALTRFQSIAPATQNVKMTSHLVTLKCQNEHFVSDFLQNFTLRKKPQKTPPEAFLHGRELTDEPTTTRPTRREHRSNPRPQL